MIVYDEGATMVAYDGTEMESTRDEDDCHGDREIEPGELLKLHLTSVSAEELIAALSEEQVQDIIYQVGKIAQDEFEEQIEHGMEQGWGWEIARGSAMAAKCDTVPLRIGFAAAKLRSARNR